MAVPRFSQWRIISVSTWVASAVDRFLPSRSAALARTQTLAGSNMRILLLAFCNLDVGYREKSVFLHRQSWRKILIQHYPTGGFHILIDCFFFTTAKTTLHCCNFSFITNCYLTSTYKLEFILNCGFYTSIEVSKMLCTFPYRATMFFHMCLIFYNYPVCNRLLRQCAQFMLGHFSTVLWLLIM